MVHKEHEDEEVKKVKGAPTQNRTGTSGKNIVRSAAYLPGA
jgi:hypothetical protein